jgi:CRISPR-associated endonuclease/helicase Cas3
MLIDQPEGQAYFEYWGKAQQQSEQNGADYHLLVYHCLDVAAVGQAILGANAGLRRDLADFLEITEEQLSTVFSFMLALHDLGKFSSAFQKLYLHDKSDLYRPIACHDYDGRNFRHDRLGLYFWKLIQSDVLAALIEDDQLDRRAQERMLDTLTVLADCVLGHHGQPINKNDPNAIKVFVEPHNEQAVAEFAKDMLVIFKPELPLEKLSSKDWQRKLKQVSWHLAGIAVIADWIGSDSHFFHYRTEKTALFDYWPIAQEIAERALAATDLWRPLNVQPFLSIQEHYGFPPTPLQHWAETVEIDQTPQLFILEDVTGAGKTEAALALTHRLIEAGAAEGFYFGLPTMATSNAMFSRVAGHYQQMLAGHDGKKPSIVLAHGAREMNDLFREAVLASGATDSNYHSTDSTATAQCNQWLADSRKKALLAPVGVGTIDQALLAVLPRRHQSLRLLGLNRKVLIFDEVHAADEYMFELLESLLGMHFHQGGSAILLTATLAKKQRQRLVDIWLAASSLPKQALQQDAFPLATKVTFNQQQPLTEYPLESRADVSREVGIKVLSSLDACVATVLDATARGECVVWVRNTVNDALDAYRLIQQHMPQAENCLLFHSRFVLQDRKTIETQVLSLFGKQSSDQERQGKVLIATQVFQESLDADADLMISDICPIDDLIQRAGRLHRHTRNTNRAYERNIKDTRPAPVLYVHAPEWDANPESDWLSREFQGSEYVYRSPGRLWLGLRELLTLGAIRMPGEARQLIESVYGDSAYEHIPETLKHKEHELLGEQRSKAAKAKTGVLNWQRHGYSAASAAGWYEDDTDIGTRHSDIETVEVVLLKKTANNGLTFWVDDQRFGLALSTVKLSKNKYGDNLAEIPADLEPALLELQRKNKYMEYQRVWIPDEDPAFTYDAVMGFSEK